MARGTRDISVRRGRGTSPLSGYYSVRKEIKREEKGKLKENKKRKTKGKRRESSGHFYFDNRNGLQSKENDRPSCLSIIITRIMTGTWASIMPARNAVTPKCTVVCSRVDWICHGKRWRAGPNRAYCSAHNNMKVKMKLSTKNKREFTQNPCVTANRMNAEITIRMNARIIKHVNIKIISVIKLKRVKSSWWI